MRRLVRWPAAWLSLCAIVVFVSGCGPADSDTPDVQVELTLEPAPPVVGDADVSLKLTDAGGALVEGAKIQVEGNMNHAGMKPSLADLREVEPGRYAGSLKFTMGGDWFLLVTAKTRDGRTSQHKIDVPGVKSR